VRNRLAGLVPDGCSAAEDGRFTNHVLECLTSFSRLSRHANEMTAVTTESGQANRIASGNRNGRLPIRPAHPVLSYSVAHPQAL